MLGLLATVYQQAEPDYALRPTAVIKGSMHSVSLPMLAHQMDGEHADAAASTRQQCYRPALWKDDRQIDGLARRRLATTQAINIMSEAYELAAVQCAWLSITISDGHIAAAAAAVVNVSAHLHRGQPHIINRYQYNDSL